jgi:alkaline phosphatase D
MIRVIKFIGTILYFLIVNSIYSQNKFSISFGSCLHQDKDKKIMETLSNSRPDIFITMGDIIYKDSLNPLDKKIEYDKLKNSPFYNNLLKSTKILGTWDDHDYGINDSGSEYPQKKDSQKLFLDFLDESPTSERRQREGIYSSNFINFNKLNIYIILLDTRYFRSSLKKKFIFWGDYTANYDENATILGNEQWAWLENELKKPSDLKIIVSSIQFFNEDHPFEKWGNFPLEKKKFLNMLKNKEISNLIILSGDRHISETFFFFENDFGNILEITSSPLNIEIPFPIVNKLQEFKIGNTIQKSNFGNILIEDKSKDYEFSFQYYLKDGEKINIPINYIIPKKK